jgi:hypothetical protein
MERQLRQYDSLWLILSQQLHNTQQQRQQQMQRQLQSQPLHNNQQQRQQLCLWSLRGLQVLSMQMKVVEV